MGGLFLWRRGGSSTTKERQSPEWVRVRMDPSLRGTCVTPNNMALSLIHMHCMAHGNGVVGGWHWCFTRVHCRNTCGKRMLRNCGALHSRWFEQCESLLSLAYVVLHACEWIFPLLLSVGVAFSL